MRLTLIGLLAGTAMLCVACSPAVGSPDWCKNMQAKMEKASLEELSKLSAEDQQGLAQCFSAALKDIAR